MQNKLNNRLYPKVLIIGESLHDKAGTGITLSNFFSDWPQKNIAVLSGKNIWLSDVTICDNLFYWETKMIFNINFPKRLTKYSNKTLHHGPIPINEILQKQENLKKNSENYISNTLSEKFKFFLKSQVNQYRKLLIAFLKILGLSPFLGKIILTDSLDKWIRLYKPDVMYTFLNNYQQFQFVIDLNKKYNVPFVVHPGDDHIKLMPPKGLLYMYWKIKMNKMFVNLITTASVRFSICDYMSYVYKEKYKLDFIPFHNPIDPEKWLPLSKNNWLNNGVFTILYAGRYGDDNADLLHRMSQVVADLNDEGYKLQFDIRLSPLTRTSDVKTFKKYKHTIIQSYIPHDEINKILPLYDLLYLPLGFNKKSIEAYSVSMSTKISEYMISGTPILVNAPENTAYFQYAKQYKWGYLLPTNIKEKMKRAILELMQNEILRKQLGSKAKSVAIEKHDVKKVRNDLRIQFWKACENSNVSFNHADTI